MENEKEFLEEEKAKANMVIDRMLSLKEKLEEKHDLALKKSYDVSSYENKIALCEMRILTEKVKRERITNILKFIWRREND